MSKQKEEEKVDPTDTEAYKYLIQKYGKGNFVYRRGKTVRFIGVDGRRYVIRRVYSGNTVWISKKIYDKLKEEEKKTVFLFIDDKRIIEVPMELIKCGQVVEGIYVQCVSKTDEKRSIQVSTDIYVELNRMRGKRTWDDFLRLVVEFLKNTTTIIADVPQNTDNKTLAAYGIYILFQNGFGKHLSLLSDLVEWKPLDELTDEQVRMIEDLMKYKLVIIESRNGILSCKAVVLGVCEFNTKCKKLKVIYMPEFCKKYCDNYKSCPRGDKGGKCEWIIPNEVDVSEVLSIGKKMVDVSCTS